MRPGHTNTLKPGIFNAPKPLMFGKRKAHGKHCGQYCHLALDNHLIADPPILNLTVALKRVALYSCHSHHLSLTMVS